MHSLNSTQTADCQEVGKPEYESEGSAPDEIMEAAMQAGQKHSTERYRIEIKKI